MKPFYCLLFLASLVGCASGSPPSAFERQAYYVTTNWVPRVTQQIQVSSNMIGTNAVLVITNIALITNMVGEPHFEPRESVQTIIKAGGAAATGVPWLIPIIGLLGALYGGWAKYRNVQSEKRATKADILNTVLSQSVETAREIIAITASPSAEKRYVENLKSAQVRAGVKPEGKQVSSERVDTGAAKAAAADVLAIPVTAVSNGH